MNGKIKKLTILCILDGWGISKISKGNAVKLAKTPNFDFLIDNFPNASLITHGLSVGLPKNQVGNSEVGHMNLGAGRKVEMDLPRINQAFSNKFFKEDKKINSSIYEINKRNGVVHIVGLCSAGGVHSYEDHIFELIKYLNKSNLKVLLHMILDGRDTSPKNALNTIKKIKKIFGNLDLIASVSGRYFAMDRDERWERTEKFYRTIVCKEGEKFDDPEVFIKNQYRKEIYDEFVKPSVSRKYCGINNNRDGIIFMNFRSDRMRQISHALCDDNFKNFLSENRPIFVSALSLVSYSKSLEKFVKTLFPKLKIKNTIGEIVSKMELKQLRLSETEKYAHVTYFFNCGNEKKLKGEDRILVQSPRVKTYDLQPKMSIEKVTDHLIKAIVSMEYDFIVVNFANPDMVGHTGNLSATVKACESVDRALGRMIEKVKKTNANALIVADHGNCEEMINLKNRQPHTSHTLNLVPIILISTDQNLKVNNGILSDVAPTLLDLMKIDKPTDMKGKSLLK